MAGQAGSGGESNTGSGGAAQAGTTEVGQGGGASFDAAELCDGSDSLRLGFQGRGTGCTPDLPCPGLSVLAELGSDYLYLDGHCNLYTKALALSGTHVKQLSDTERSALEADLRLAEWPPAGTYCENSRNTDGGISGRFYLAGAVINLAPCVDDVRIVPDAALLNNYILNHFDEGEPVTGPARYTLVPTTVPTSIADDYFGSAPTFPLTDLNVVTPAMMVSWGTNSPIMLADGADAEALRSLREAWLQSAGPQPGDFIPVLDMNDASRLELRVRDVLPLEDMAGMGSTYLF